MNIPGRYFKHLSLNLHLKQNIKLLKYILVEEGFSPQMAPSWSHLYLHASDSVYFPFYKR